MPRGPPREFRCQIHCFFTEALVQKKHVALVDPEFAERGVSGARRATGGLGPG